MVGFWGVSISLQSGLWGWQGILRRLRKDVFSWQALCLVLWWRQVTAVRKDGKKEGRDRRKKGGRERSRDEILNGRAGCIFHNLPSFLNSALFQSLFLPPLLLLLSSFFSWTLMHTKYIYFGDLPYIGATSRNKKVWTSKNPVYLDKISLVKHMESSAWGFLQTMAFFSFFPTMSFGSEPTFLTACLINYLTL